MWAIKIADLDIEGRHVVGSNIYFFNDYKVAAKFYLDKKEVEDAGGLSGLFITGEPKEVEVTTDPLNVKPNKL